MRKEQAQIIHVEFADFRDALFFELFDKYVVRNANSLGMNEQEMIMLLNVWDGKSNLEQVQNSQPDFQEILTQLKTFFTKQAELGLDISRVHLHPYGSFFMCYNSKKWTDARDAIIKSAMAVPLYCKDPDASSLDDLSDFEVGAMPE